MTQATDWSVPLHGPASPDVYSQRVDDSLDALLSSHSGSTRPAYAVAGTEWVSTATAGKLKKYLYDGANDRLIETIDIATGAIIYSNGTVDDVLATKAPKSVYAVKSAGYTAVAADAGGTIRFTAAATLALTAAATLGNGWPLSVIADGADVTIDPNGSETINGQATLTVPNGSSAEIICDGTGFYTVMKPLGWEVIPGGHVVQSGVGAVNFTNLGNFKRLWITGSVGGVTPAAVYIHTSTNNGSSYDQGASDYTHQYIQSSATAVAAARASAGAGAISANASNGIQFSTIIESFNSAQGCSINTVAQLATGGTIVLETTTSARTSATPRNAFRLITGAATLTCDITVLGMRG